MQLLTQLKPKAMGRYSASVSYAANSLVTSEDGATAYLSVQDVPAGTLLSNTEYWKVHTDLSTVKNSAEAAAERADAARDEMLEIARELSDPLAASGNPVTAVLLGGMPFDSVETTLSAVQAGEGDSSPSNIRSITGWMDNRLIRCGKNLLDYDVWKNVTITRGEAVWENNGVTLTATGNDCYTDMRDVVIPVMPGKAVTLSWDAEIVAGDGYGYVYIFPNGQTENMAMGTVATQSLTYTAADDVTYMAFRVGVGVAGGVIAFKNVMLNYGTTAEAYEPFLGNDAFTAAFDQTIYGGTLNWTTGEMAVEWELKTLDGTDNVIKNDNEPFKIGLPENSDYQLACCSHYTVATSLNADLSVYYASNYYGNNKLCIYDSRFADTDSFKAFLAAQYAAGTPVQIVYKLATPTTIQLSPREIYQLRGKNTLYGDGVVSINGRQRPADALLKRVEALEAALAE